MLGCLADDYTGAADLGAMLSRAGLRVALHFDLPEEAVAGSAADAAIIALKSRSIRASDAVAASLAALDALRAAGATRFFFKYCSTFDSTDDGNIGPVAAALADALGARRVLFCPAFPENGRTVDGGQLFVHGRPLNESGMERHPLNPMTDADLVRVLGRQVAEPVGRVTLDQLERGADAARDAITGAAERLLIADATADRHLATLASAAADEPLVTGGSAIAHQLAAAYQRTGALPPPDPDGAPALAEGLSAVLAGSCSAATRRQVARLRETAPSLRLDPLAIAAGEQTAGQALAWAERRLADGPVLVYSSAEPPQVADADARLGPGVASRLIEDTMGRIARGLVERGVRRLVVAGGETSGATLAGLGVRSVRIGPEIAPGVPWVATCGEPRLALALKSGNFGSDDFFLRALELLP